MARGSPAPAGMDPSLAACDGIAQGLPRTRGDGPPPALSVAMPHTAPPHPRGWTLLGSHAGRLRLRLRGSPAPAGMDPTNSAGRSCAKGLPRTRGDGPCLRRVPGYKNVAPPHPRGWTPGESRWTGKAKGSPAPAGMDPVQSRVRQGAAGLPRTRGDGPHRIKTARGWTAAPPHPRGWTHTHAVAQEFIAGSPAPAGMDPFGICARPASDRLPRTRGDGPAIAQFRDCSRPAPPHPRGWTHSTHTHADTDTHPGSPAPAGMDPCRPSASRRG